MSWVSDSMPSRFVVLVMGDWQRFRKYHLITANLILLTIWVLATLAMDKEQLTQFLPFIFLMDSTVMTMVLIGTAIFYEKQEHTIDAILTSPVSQTEYLSAKVTTGIVNSLVTLAFVTVTIWLVKGVMFNHWAYLLPAIIVVAGFHAMLGIALTYGAKDFTAIMLRSVVYMFLIWLPAVFTLFGIIPDTVVRYLLILPPASAARLLTAGVSTVAGWQLVFGYLYLVPLCVVLYVGVVKPGFQRYVVREIGV
jgi:fluoroquinolone transport system permease protein